MYNLIMYNLICYNPGKDNRTLLVDKKYDIEACINLLKNYSKFHYSAFNNVKILKNTSFTQEDFEFLFHLSSDLHQMGLFINHRCVSPDLYWYYDNHNEDRYFQFINALDDKDVDLLYKLWDNEDFKDSSISLAKAAIIKIRNLNTIKIIVE